VVAADSATLAVGPEYGEFAEFSERFRTALTALGEGAGVTRADRLGIRYVNIAEVPPGDPDAWRTWFRPDLTGWSATATVADGARLLASITQTQLAAPPSNGGRWRFGCGRRRRPFLPTSSPASSTTWSMTRTSGGNLKYHQGTRIYPDSGNHIHNWPRQQYDNGVAKNNATGRRFKRMVRALKRLENELCTQGLLDDELPSFLMECLVYNVPNDCFNQRTYVADMRAVLATIFNATRNKADCSEWLEVNERKYLFHASQGWTYQQAHALADAAWDYMGFESACQAARSFRSL